MQTFLANSRQRCFLQFVCGFSSSRAPKEDAAREKQKGREVGSLFCRAGGVLCGRPRGRKVVSKPNCSTACRCHVPSPPAPHEPRNPATVPARPPFPHRSPTLANPAPTPSALPIATAALNHLLAWSNCTMAIAPPTLPIPPAMHSAPHSAKRSTNARPPAPEML
jgi:hypothetical protein